MKQFADHRQSVTATGVGAEVRQHRAVELGVRTPGFVEVRSGVEPEELVVVGGLERLQEGAPVAPRVVERRPVRAGESTPPAPGAPAADSAPGDSAPAGGARPPAE